MPIDMPPPSCLCLWLVCSDSVVGRILGPWLVRPYKANYDNVQTAHIHTVHRLLHPPSGKTKQTGTAIALIVVYSALFFIMLASYARIIHRVYTSPGFVPLPTPRESVKETSPRSSTSSRSGLEQGEKRVDAVTNGYLERTAVLKGKAESPPGLEEFYTRDVFECDVDGLPKWCSVCQNWKPDRSHHSSEASRCVYKLDHFCPW